MYTLKLPFISYNRCCAVCFYFAYIYFFLISKYDYVGVVHQLPY